MSSVPNPFKPAAPKTTKPAATTAPAATRVVVMIAAGCERRLLDCVRWPMCRSSARIACEAFKRRQQSALGPVLISSLPRLDMSAYPSRCPTTSIAGRSIQPTNSARWLHCCQAIWPQISRSNRGAVTLLVCGPQKVVHSWSQPKPTPRKAKTPSVVTDGV